MTSPAPQLVHWKAHVAHYILMEGERFTGGSDRGELHRYVNAMLDAVEEERHHFPVVHFAEQPLQSDDAPESSVVITTTQADFCELFRLLLANPKLKDFDLTELLNVVQDIFYLVAEEQSPGDGYGQLERIAFVPPLGTAEHQSSPRSTEAQEMVDVQLPPDLPNAPV